MVDIFVDFFGCHTDTVVADGERSSLFVEAYADFKVVGFAFKFARCSERAQLLCCIDGIGNHLTKEDFVVGIEEFLDNRKDVFCCYTYFTFLHSCMFYLLISICL